MTQCNDIIRPGGDGTSFDIGATPCDETNEMTAQLGSSRTLSGSDSYRQTLAREFKRRIALNPAYSLRAYARDLSISVSRISEILSGKSGLSPANAQKVVDNLRLPPLDRARFLQSVLASHGRSASVRKEARRKLEEYQNEKPDKELGKRHLRMIAHWYFMAIPELFSLEGFQVNAAAVAKKLAIPEAKAREALEHLHDVGWLRKTENGWVAEEEFRVVATESPSKAIRHFHREMLRRAESAIEGQAMEERDLSCLVLAVAPEEIEPIREMILKFRRRVNRAVAANAAKKKEVYGLAIQLFRLSERGP